MHALHGVLVLGGFTTYVVAAMAYLRKAVGQ